jgi:hypothetical protein
MIKKMTLLAMVVGAVAAFAAPGMANAAKLTQPKGTLVPVGTTLVGTSSNTVSVTTLGTIKCKKVTIFGIVEVNNGTTVTIGMDSTADKAEECEVVGLGGVTIHPTLTTIHAENAGPGTASFDFEVVGLCKAESNGTSEVTWNGTDVIKIKAGLKNCGTGSLTGEFTLETTAGVGIIAET